MTDCVTHFCDQWLSKNCNWYEGAALGYPSTNNSIESTNVVVKRKHTFRERLPVGQFSNAMVGIRQKWSRDRKPMSVNCIPFCQVPSVSLRQWIDAYHWVMENQGSKFF